MDHYRIISDSTTDLAPEMVEEMDVTILPLQFLIDEKSYYNYPDERDLSGKKFYELIRGGKSATTVQINVDTFLTCFEKYLKNGEDILYFAFSSGLSGTFNSANIAANELREKYPDRKLILIDSLAASMGEGLLLYYAASKKKAGASIDEVASWLETNKNHLCHWFTVDDLFHLKRGGRVSSFAAVVGTTLGIKPVLHVDDEGHLIPVQKVRGRKQALANLVEHMEKTCTNPEEQTIFISHGDCEEDALYVADLVRQKFKVRDIKVHMIGPVIGAHSGPGTVALFFLGTQK